MNIEEIREYCLSKRGVTESFPFNEVTLVFKVFGKMFILLNLEGETTIAVKCDPVKAIELREQYSAVIPGYHLNKKHWNTVMVNGLLTDKLICSFIDHSYELVFNSLSKK